MATIHLERCDKDRDSAQWEAVCRDETGERFALKAAYPSQAIKRALLHAATMGIEVQHAPAR